jgi:hypothetical protein
VGFLEDLELGLEIAQRLAGLGGLVAVGLEIRGGGFRTLAELGGVMADGGFGLLLVVEGLLESGAKLAGGFVGVRLSRGIGGC